MNALRFLDRRIEELIVVTCLGIMTAVIGLQVFMRYVMQNSLSWTEELARYLFIFFVYAGISYGVKLQRHIKVEAFTMWLPAKAQDFFKIVSDLFFLAFAVFIIYFGFRMTARIFKLHQVSAALQLPMGFVYGTLPFCYCLVTFRLLQNLYHSISNFVKPKEGGSK